MGANSKSRVLTTKLTSWLIDKPFLFSSVEAVGRGVCRVVDIRH